jgi:hypothetical protein
MKTKRFLWSFSLSLFLFIVSITFAQVPKTGSGMDAANFIPMRERVQIMQKFWDWKRENVLPMILREQGVDMWIIRNDEEPLYRQTSYREHPVYTSLLPANHEGQVLPSNYQGKISGLPEFLLFYDRGSTIEYVEPENYDHITRLVRERDPKKIAIHMKNLYIRRQNFGGRSQLTIVTGDEMQQALGNKYVSRTVDSLELGILWLSIMDPVQISMYRYVQGVQNDVIAEAFSNKVIIPNYTTTDDVNWWIRHRYRDLHLDIDNNPGVDIWRRPSKIAEYKDSSGLFRGGLAGDGRTNGENVIIRRGDVVTLDSDIMLLGLETDSHQHAYVLLERETDVPEELKEALRIVNDIQDQYRKEFILGRTAGEIRESGNRIPRHPRIIESSLSFHPPPMFIRRFTANDLQFSRGTYVAGMGSRYKQHPLLFPAIKLHYNMIYAYEPHTTVAVPGWGEHGIELGIGQIAAFTENGLEYLNRPMLEWHVVK